MIRLPTARWPRRGLGLGAGGLIAFSMPPWGWWPLAPIGIALWSLLLDGERRGTRALTGMIVSWGWFLPSTLWMVKFTPAGWPFAVMVWFGALGALTSAIRPANGSFRHLALAGALILSEWFRWHAPFGGVPLSMLAMTQARGPLLAVARVGGSLLVSGAVAFVGAALASLITDARRVGALTLAAVIVVAGLGIVAPAGHAVRTISAAAVQGGGQQQTKSAATDYWEVFQRHLREAQKISDPVDLIVWPENVINVSEFRSSADYPLVAELARKRHATVVVGVVEDLGGPTTFLNAAIAFGPDGKEIGRYDKVRRVPFGEYVPLRGLLAPMAGSMLPPRDQVPGRDPNVLPTPAGRLGVVISWEVFFGRRVRAAMHDDAQLILNPTNGSSYWLSQVQTQQLASSVLRAVESGRWLIQAAPTGFSEIIDPAGNVHDRTSITEAAAVQRDVELRDGNTIAVTVGDVPAAAIALLALAAAWAGLPRRNRDHPQHRHGRAEP